MEREDILKMCNAFRTSKILMAANEFDIFTLLSSSPMSAPELAKELDAPKIELLLNALVALDLLEKRGDTYQNSRAAENFLVAGKEGYVGYMLKHMNNHYETWNGLEVALSGRKPDIDLTENFTRAMEENAYVRAAELAESVDLTGKKRLLDVGGGPGAYSAAFVKKYPGLEAVVFDLPGPIDVATGLLNEKGLLDRVKTVEGDFEIDDFEKDFDCVLISNILHFQDEAENKKLLKKAAGALREDGTIIIHGPILDDGRTSPEDAAIFAIHMLLNSEGGRTYTWSEIESWLQEAGFTGPERIQLSESRAIVTKISKTFYR